MASPDVLRRLGWAALMLPLWAAAAAESGRSTGEPPGLRLAYPASFSHKTGVKPDAGLTLAADGFFYGTTTAGGANRKGTVYRLSRSGSLKVLHDFDDTAWFPIAHLAIGADGALYGVALYGAGSLGTIFRVTTDGDFSVLHRFRPPDCQHPNEGLVVHPDGLLYGTCEESQGTRGTVYGISTAGDFHVVASFSGAEGQYPIGSLTVGDDGDLYGQTSRGGAADTGTVYKVSPSGVLTKLADFLAPGDQLQGALSYDAGHKALYGTSFLGACLSYRNGTVTIVGHTPTGRNFGTLALAPDGKRFYATSFSDSAVYSLSFAGTVQKRAVLDGQSLGELAFDAGGALWGTTHTGGDLGKGAVFRIKGL